MKSAVSAGLVAALLLPDAVGAGSCPKYARGSNRITCHMFVDQKDVKQVGKKKDGGFKFLGGNWGSGKKSKNEIEVNQTTTTYAWSFFWNYIAADDCPTTRAHLTAILPPLGRMPHDVKCKVEVRWTPEQDNKCDGNDYDKGHGHNLYDPFDDRSCNVTWDFAGNAKIDQMSLPAKMKWPLTASFSRPEYQYKSNDLNVKHELANEGDMFKLEIHSGKGNDFIHTWGRPVSGFIGWKKEKDEQFESDNNKGDKKGDKDKKKDKEGKQQEVKKDVAKFHGFYNTKNLYSCWVFDKFHVVSHKSTGKGKKGKKGDKQGDNQDNDNNDSYMQGTGENGPKDLIQGVPEVHFHLPTWSTCEPRPPLPCFKEEVKEREKECEGEACKGDDKRESDSGSDSESGSDEEWGSSGSDCEGDE